MNFVHKWSTPELVIHNGRDYRAVEAEGMAVFHALQQYVNYTYLTGTLLIISPGEIFLVVLWFSQMKIIGL